VTRAKVDRGRFLGLRRDRDDQRGQGLVEFAALVPVFMLLLLGMLEFGFAFDQNLTLEYATREGARVGSALANGGGDLGCGVGESPNRDTVDPQIVAAVQRVLVSPGSRVKPAPGMQVQIWKSNATGGVVGGTTNTWTYVGFDGSGNGLGTEVVDGQRIAFVETSKNWNACARTNGGTSGVDSIGVSLVHTYQFQTGLSGILGFFGSSFNQLTMSDKTVMALNPTD
jgi:hypothetical protein